MLSDQFWSGSEIGVFLMLASLFLVCMVEHLYQPEGSRLEQLRRWFEAGQNGAGK